MSNIIAPAIASAPAIAIASAPASAPATVAPAAPARVKSASMRDIKAAAPEFFTANLSDLLAALSDKVARVAALSMALAGAAIERAQSGNLPPAWAAARATAEGLKGQTKARALAAVAHVEGIKPGSIKAPDVEAFSAFGYAVAAELSAILTPPAAKPRETSARVDWKARAEAAEAERDALAAEVEAMRAMLKARGIAAPAAAPALI